MDTASKERRVTSTDALGNGARIVGAGSRAVRTPASEIVAENLDAESIIALTRRANSPKPHTTVPLTGVAAPDHAPGQTLFELAVEAAEKGLDVLGDALLEHANKRGKPDEEPLRKVLGDTIVETAKAEAESLLKLSAAFAAGAGEAIESVNAELASRYDTRRLSPDEITPRDFELLQDIRRFDQNRVEALPRVLKKGLEAAAQEAAKLVSKKVAKALAKTLKNLGTQIATKLVKDNDIFLAANAAATEALERIPEQRRKVEEIALKFVVTAGISQLDDKGTRDRLKELLPEKSDEGVGVAMLASILRFVANHSYEHVTRDTPLDSKTVDYALSELRTVLIEQAFRERSRLGDRVVSKPGGEVEILGGNKIAVPESLFNEIKDSPYRASSARRNAWSERTCAFQGLVYGYRKRLEGLARVYQRKIDRTPLSRSTDVWVASLDALAKQRLDYRKKAAEVLEAIVKEFGETFDGTAVRLHLEQTVYHALTAFPEDAPLVHDRQN